MIRLAGLYEEAVPETPEGSQVTVSVESAVADGLPMETEATATVNEVQTYASRIVRYGLTRLALPGILVAGSGYLLASLGWNASWVMMLYVNLAMGLILVQSFMKLRRTSELRELFFISVFFLLGSYHLMAPVLRMDPYGFYAIADFGGTPIPFMLALVVNLLLSLVAGLTFEFLWRWQYWGRSGSTSPFCRAGWVAFPPLGLVYLFTIFFTCLGSWVFLLVSFSILGWATLAFLILRDKEVKFNEWERRLLLQGGMAFAVVLTALGGSGTLIFYLEPSFLSIPDHTLLRSWDIDFKTLGYSMDELMDRYRHGVVWSSVATLVYMVLVIGGGLLVAIYRMDAVERRAPIVNM